MKKEKKIIMEKEKNLKETIGTLIRVTMTVDYIIPPHDNDVQGTIKEWFLTPDKYPLGSRHVYRDGYKIGFSEKVIDVKEIPLEEAYPPKKDKL